MGFRQIVLWLLLMIAGQSLTAREIVVGIEPVPIRKMAILITPVVLPDLISAKLAFEYRLHPKWNLIIPVEAKWMDYHKAIKLAAELFGADTNVPEKWYAPDSQLKPGWNIDIYQFKVSTGAGAKWFPFSESMTNAFFVKGLLMVGYERLHSYMTNEKNQDGAIFTEVLSIGYNWVKKNRFTFGFEAGQEYSIHTNPIKKMPPIVDGFLPFLQFSLGFTI